MRQPEPSVGNAPSAFRILQKSEVRIVVAAFRRPNRYENVTYNDRRGAFRAPSPNENAAKIIADKKELPVKGKLFSLYYQKIEVIPVFTP